MNICICTTPIRPVPTTYPPFGSMAIIQSLRKIGENVSFFNIDYFRYNPEKIERHFAENQFDVVGISAVVSTAYAYTRQLAALIRTVSPKTVIVLGGNLAASAEILMRKTKVDFCVVGDGELIIQDLVRILREKPLNFDRLRATKGLCFLDERGRFEFTGFGQRPAADEIEWPDYDILEADGSLPYFISDQVDDRFDGINNRLQPDDRLATVVMTKGCVARCTFCHRWEKGFRARPVDQVVEHVRHLKERYHARFIDVSDENFGSDREVAWELAERLGELGVIWRCAGVRTRTVSKESLLHWKANGCTSVIYGIESGSPTMLKVMEKNATLQENINALKWTYEVGLGTVVQLVIGMPGETDKTIYETIDFLKTVAPYQKAWGEHAPSELLSINYAQSLPGTPLYEWAREHGYIGKTLDEEEQYLLKISDTDAYNEDHFINYTGLPMLKVLMWRPMILAELDAFHLRQKGIAHLSLWRIVKYYFGMVTHRVIRKLGLEGFIKTSGTDAFLWGETPKHGEGAAKTYNYITDSGFFNIHSNLKFAPLLLNPLTRSMFYPLLAVAIAAWRGHSPLNALRLVGEHVLWSCTAPFRPAPKLPDQSLRKIVAISELKHKPSQDKMIPLRLGR